MFIQEETATELRTIPRTHIQNANKWQHTWTNVEQSINQKLQREMEEIHKKQQQKIHNLTTSKAKVQTTLE
jgi:hypothetical protein